jgi:hypothetical protein
MIRLKVKQKNNNLDLAVLHFFFNYTSNRISRELANDEVSLH